MNGPPPEPKDVLTIAQEIMEGRVMRYEPPFEHGCDLQALWYDHAEVE